MRVFTRALCVLSLAAALGGCAGSPRTTASQENLANPTNPGDAIGQLDKELADARENKVDVLAPRAYGKAADALKDAKAIQAKNGTMADIFNYCTIGRTELKKATETAAVARVPLADVMKARQDAIQAGAKDLGEDYDSVESRFLKLTSAIEDNDLQWAENHKGDVLAQYRQVEVKAIKKLHLEAARETIDQAVKHEAKKYAPTSLFAAEEALKDADSYIAANPYNRDQVRAKGESALFQARRALAITDQSRLFSTMKPEDVTLWVEAKTASLTTHLGTRDNRDQALGIQLSALETSIDGLRRTSVGLASEKEQLSADKAKLTAETERLTTETGRLSTEKEQLEIDKSKLDTESGKLKSDVRSLSRKVAASKRSVELDKEYESVRSQFAPEEAEVVRDGERIVIRVRVLKFPVGKNTVLPENYALLGKIGKSIKEFDQPKIVIEGHTDQVGSAKTNLRLSQARADAVKAYFIANETVKADRITAVGYGFTRPLSDEKTAAGRATNRRIDVIIVPGANVTPPVADSGVEVY